MSSAEFFSDTIIIMSKGKLIVSGNSVDLKKIWKRIHNKGINQNTSEQVTMKFTE